MERFGSLTGARVLGIAAIALMIVAAPRLASAQTPPPAAAQAAAPDPLKFATNAPAIIGWVIKADKAKDFEEFWPALRALIAKSENAELRAYGDTLTKIFKVDQPNFEMGGSQAVQYLMQIDAPSTAHSYNPQVVIYTYLGAGVEGSKLTRAEADPLYKKLTDAFLGVNPLWKLVKIGG